MSSLSRRSLHAFSSVLRRRTAAARSRALFLGVAFGAALTLVAAFTASCRAQSGHPTLHVAAAADLQPLLPAVLQRFEQQTGVHAEVSFQSSATLAQQILNGAPFDVFLAADMSFPEKVIGYGLATEAKPVPYARGTLVLWCRKDAPVLHGHALSFAVLRNSALRSVAIANPEHAPYGRAAQAAIAGMHLSSTLGPKLRVAENIAQAAQYADSGNAEVGFLSLTSARTERLEADGTFLPVAPELYPPIVQGAIVLRQSKDRADAERLLHFLATPEIRALLAKSGLMPPA